MVNNGLLFYITRIENENNVTRFGAYTMDDSVVDTNPPNFGLN